MSRDPLDLDELLRADAVDPGCGAGTIIDAYVELEVSGQNPGDTYPAWQAHLRSCPACRQDYEGLTEAARLFGDA